MRALWTAEENIWRLTFLLDPEDDTLGTCTDGQRLELRINSCQVRLPRRLSYGVEIHPDLLALAAWTVVAPWTRRRITFDRPISTALAEGLYAGWGVEAGPVGVAQRSGKRLAISYSGGADSAAVAAILPDAPFVHFQRISHPRVPNRWTHYRAEVLARLAARTGRELAVAQSDLEFLLSYPRPGYPEHHAVAAGALLLADEMDLGGIAFGYELGSRWLGGDRYTHRFSPDNPMWAADGKWGRLFAAAGLRMVLPVGGISEPVTMRIAMTSELAPHVRWCLTGDMSGPCGMCSKCLIKELILASVERRPLKTAITADMRQAAKWQEPPPYGGLETLQYGCARVPGIEDTPFAKAAGYLQATDDSVRWLDHCYTPAILEVPERWREAVRDYMVEHVGLMTADEARRVETWGV